MSLPRRVLAGLCVAAGLSVENGRVSSEKPVPVTILGEIDSAIHQVIVERGPVVTADVLRDACLARGINRTSFFIHLTYSPVVQRVAKGVYALRGAEVDPAEVAALAGRRRPKRTSLKDSGWTRDRALWLGYVVTQTISIVE